MTAMRTPEEIMDDILQEACRDSCGEPRDPREYQNWTDTYHNNAQQHFLYEKAMELAAAVMG